MNYHIVSFKSNDIPEDIYNIVSDILHDAFEERLQQGIDFKCGSFTSEELKADLAGDSFLFVAFDDNAEAVGTVSLKIRQKKGFVYGGYENLGVISSCKGKGVASILTDELIKKSNELNLDFIASSTKCNAKSSVAFHQKKGFKIYMKSFGKGCSSYNFIFPLKRLQLLKNELLRKSIFAVTTSIGLIKSKL